MEETDCLDRGETASPIQDGLLCTGIGGRPGLRPKKAWETGGAAKKIQNFYCNPSRLSA